MGGRPYSEHLNNREAEWLDRFRTVPGEAIRAIGTWREWVVDIYWRAVDAIEANDNSEFRPDLDFGNLTSIIALWCDVELKIDPSELCELNRRFQAFRPRRQARPLPDPGYDIVYTPLTEQEVEDLMSKALVKWDRILHATSVVAPQRVVSSTRSLMEGVSLLDAATAASEGDSNAGRNTKRRWQDTHRRGAPLPPPLGKAAGHPQMDLYKPSAIAEWAEKNDGVNKSKLTYDLQSLLQPVRPN